MTPINPVFLTERRGRDFYIDTDGSVWEWSGGWTKSRVPNIPKKPRKATRKRRGRRLPDGRHYVSKLDIAIRLSESMAA